jgi:hypothetical protein
MFFDHSKLRIGIYFARRSYFTVNFVNQSVPSHSCQIERTIHKFSFLFGQVCAMVYSGMLELKVSKVFYYSKSPLKK